ncbi:YqhG family protein [Paenibacillus sp. N3/727]|uniref:YqhG family protein n=1 Tax=Paenibacillus sp. N3/727 TaxID=2925845 RepID=UPI001F5366A2|nr:YqhG family protein [Paenibacillus sp. N3/727]UNK17033.1 YqhG family protein [Paenibacillus sp. N3/727]
MTMTPQEVQQHFMAYLEATECTVIEKSPEHVTVKLSPQADKMLTNRPYYWGFVERTGAPAETLSFSFVFDPPKYDERLAKQAESIQVSQPGGGQDPLLSRYYGSAPVLPVIGPGRIQREDIIYGSRRLAQIWDASREEGKCVYLFEQPGEEQRPKTRSAPYEQWLGICFKVEFSCDLKREELHFLGISLSRKTIMDNFPAQLEARNMTPRLPENVHVRPAALTLPQAAAMLEDYLISKLGKLDYTWAEQAQIRLQEELAIVDSYYEDLLNEPDEEKKMAIQEQYQSRRSEMEWQYSPKVSLSAITCGLFHLCSSSNGTS